MKSALVQSIMTIAFLVLSPVSAMASSSDFQKAYHEGAGARVEFRVVDDAGLSVPGDKVNAFFDMVDRSKGRRIVGMTDTNGVFIAEARTMGVVEIEVSCAGYYCSKDELCLISMGNEHEVRNGRWQPWGMRKNILIRPIRRPTAVQVREGGWRTTRAINEWVGFDVRRYDYVSPWGKGTDADFEVYFDWDGKWRSREYAGMDVKIRFPEKFTGGYYRSLIMNSEFQGVYEADVNEAFLQSFSYGSRVVRDKRGLVVKRVGERFDETKTLVVRSRSQLTANGELKSACYSQISHLKFACGQDGVGICFQVIYNPVQNDTNLEPQK